jgi:hypothetical protein
LSTVTSVSSCGALVSYYFSAVCSVIIAIHTLHIVKEIVIKDLFEAVYNTERTTREESNNNDEEREDFHNGKKKRQ